MPGPAESRDQDPVSSHGSIQSPFFDFCQIRPARVCFNLSWGYNRLMLMHYTDFVKGKNGKQCLDIVIWRMFKIRALYYNYIHIYIMQYDQYAYTLNTPTMCAIASSRAICAPPDLVPIPSFRTVFMCVWACARCQTACQKSHQSISHNMLELIAFSLSC